MNPSNFTSKGMAMPCFKTKNKWIANKQYFGFIMLLFCCGVSLSAQNSFFVSSNTQQAVGVFEVTTDGFITESIFRNITADADGIYYDEMTDVLYQLNRTNGAVAAYDNVKANLANGNTPPLSAMSAAETINGREIAVSGNRLVVAQDGNDANGNQNRLIVFDISPTEITLAARYDVDFNLWGIHIDGETLYAVEDNSNHLTVFNNFFFLPNGKINPTQVISVEGIVRTHGLTYVADKDMMLLTDVGAGSSPEDGAIVVINNFVNASSDGIISDSEQVRIAGANTFLGNPVDIAYDGQRNMIYVAERANGGGRILGFVKPTASGDIAPLYNDLHAGAAAIYFADGDGNNFMPPVVIENFDTKLVVDNTPKAVTFKVYPNPASALRIK